jgi:hypothetical protein
MPPRWRAASAAASRSDESGSVERVGVIVQRYRKPTAPTNRLASQGRATPRPRAMASVSDGRTAGALTSFEAGLRDASDGARM